jgi:hypothetical protein
MKIKPDEIIKEIGKVDREAGNVLGGFVVVLIIIVLLFCIL